MEESSLKIKKSSYKNAKVYRYFHPWEKWHLLEGSTDYFLGNFLFSKRYLLANWNAYSLRIPWKAISDTSCSLTW